MCFTYTFRDNTGARREATLEAASREAAFAALKADGILPLSIREGGKVSPRPLTVSRRRDSSKKDHTRKPFTALFCLLAAIAVIAPIAWWCATRDDTPLPENTAVVANKNNKPKPDNGGKSKGIKGNNTGRTDLPETARTPKDVKTDHNPNSPLTQNPEVIKPEDTEASSTTNDTKESEPPKPLFSSGAEQLLALATPSVPGAMVPPLPYVTEESVKDDLEKAMRNVIRPEDSDTEETLERKLTVAAQKEEFRALRKEGMTFTEYLNAMREKNNDDAQLLSDAHKLDEELYKDATLNDEEYRKQREQINSTLRARGLPEITEERD